MRRGLIGMIFLVISLLGIWVGVQEADAPAPTLSPTNAAGEVVFDGTNTICYDLPPDDVAWQIVEAAAAWGLPGGQVTRCKSPTECAVEVGEKRACYFARWYPAGHPDWPQGGWTFRPAPEGFPCRPVPWSIARPALPYGTPTPVPVPIPRISLP